MATVTERTADTEATQGPPTIKRVVRAQAGAATIKRRAYTPGNREHSAARDTALHQLYDGHEWDLVRTEYSAVGLTTESGKFVRHYLVIRDENGREIKASKAEAQQYAGVQPGGGMDRKRGNLSASFLAAFDDDAVEAPAKE